MHELFAVFCFVILMVFFGNRSQPTKQLPKRPARQLRNRLISLSERCAQHARYAHKLAAQMDDGAIDFDFIVKRKEQQLELEIREAFLHFMVDTLTGEGDDTVPTYNRCYLLLSSNFVTSDFTSPNNFVKRLFHATSSFRRSSSTSSNFVTKSLNKVTQQSC